MSPTYERGHSSFRDSFYAEECPQRMKGDTPQLKPAVIGWFFSLENFLK